MSRNEFAARVAVCADALAALAALKEDLRDPSPLASALAALLPSREDFVLIAASAREYDLDALRALDASTVAAVLIRDAAADAVNDALRRGRLRDALNAFRAVPLELIDALALDEYAVRIVREECGLLRANCTAAAALAPFGAKRVKRKPREDGVKIRGTIKVAPDSVYRDIDRVINDIIQERDALRRAARMGVPSALRDTPSSAGASALYAVRGALISASDAELDNISVGGLLTVALAGITAELPPLESLSLILDDSPEGVGGIILRGESLTSDDAARRVIVDAAAAPARARAAALRDELRAAARDAREKMDVFEFFATFEKNAAARAAALRDAARVDASTVDASALLDSAALAVDARAQTEDARRDALNAADALRAASLAYKLAVADYNAAVARGASVYDAFADEISDNDRAALYSLLNGESLREFTAARGALSRAEGARRARRALVRYHRRALKLAAADA